MFVGGIDRNEWHTKLKVNERDITFKLDTGADANVLPLDVYKQVLSDVPMTRTDTILTAFGNSKIHPEGEVKLEVKCQETSMTKLLSFYVTSASDIAIFSTAMNLVTRVAIDSVSNTTVLTKDSLLEIYGDVFTGIVEYKKPYHIEVDSSVPPVIQDCRKVPYARYDNLKQTLSDLEKKGIVASVDKPTDWVHNLVITEKRDGRMRVCLDPKPFMFIFSCHIYILYQSSRIFHIFYSLKTLKILRSDPLNPQIPPGSYMANFYLHMSIPMLNPKMYF